MKIKALTNLTVVLLLLATACQKETQKKTVMQEKNYCGLMTPESVRHRPLAH
jgi:hypothetical protein